MVWLKAKRILNYSPPSLHFYTTLYCNVCHSTLPFCSPGVGGCVCGVPVLRPWTGLVILQPSEDCSSLWPTVPPAQRGGCVPGSHARLTCSVSLCGAKSFTHEQKMYTSGGTNYPALKGADDETRGETQETLFSPLSGVKPVSCTKWGEWWSGASWVSASVCCPSTSWNTFLCLTCCFSFNKSVSGWHLSELCRWTYVSDVIFLAKA